ncbi:HAMP domain-containing sensor histidine kinase [soil metagenome]
MISRPRQWSLRTRLGVVSTLAATVGLGVAGVTAYVVTSRLLHDQIEQSLREAPTSVGRVGSAVAAPPAAVDRCALIESSRAPSPGLYVLMLIEPDGTRCADPGAATVVVRDGDLDSGSSGLRVRDGSLSNGHSARVAVLTSDDGTVLITARDTQSIDTVLTVLLAVLAAVTVLGAGLALTLSRYTTRVALRPVTRFAKVAERIAETGSLEGHAATHDESLARGRDDELDRLTLAFDQMTAVLADAQMRQRRLVADAGHELRTPLTSLRANVALLRRSRAMGRSLPPDDEERLLADLTSQVTELSSLIDDLAELALADTAPQAFAAVRLDETVQDAVDRALSRADGHDFRIALEPWSVNGDAAALERAVVNLLDNALKFSPAGSTIEVTLADGTVTVADRGPGLTGEDPARVFERFWRAPSARPLPGSGLGLSIVRDVAVRHGGRAALEPRPDGGTLARLTIPGTSPA